MGVICLDCHTGVANKHHGSHDEVARFGTNSDARRHQSKHDPKELADGEKQTYSMKIWDRRRRHDAA